jgi:hypothetical protein
MTASQIIKLSEAFKYDHTEEDGNIAGITWQEIRQHVNGGFIVQGFFQKTAEDGKLTGGIEEAQLSLNSTEKGIIFNDLADAETQLSLFESAYRSNKNNVAEIHPRQACALA